MIIEQAIFSQFEAKCCRAKSTNADGASKCKRTQGQTSANDEGDKSDVDEFVEDNDDKLDDEELAAMDELGKELEEEEADDINESDECAELFILDDDEINLGVFSLTKVCELPVHICTATKHPLASKTG